MLSCIYYDEGKLVAESGDVKVYEMFNSLFLEIGPGRNLWALESEYVDYIKQLAGKPRHKCLEIGLGMGIASRCILTCPHVTSLTTIESREDIISIHEQVCPILDDGSRLEKWLPYNGSKHRIYNCGGLEYLYGTNAKYDFIFLDFYSHIDEETMPQIEDMVKAAKACLEYDGILIGWFDPYTVDEFVDPFFNLFKKKEAK